KTKKAFADEISSLTILTSEEIQTLFPKKADRVELEELLKIINLDIDDKEKKIKLIENIEKVGGAIIKIGKKILSVV
ncbi:MAG TPA: hypothetical protein VF985_00760, partial [Mariniflexile sp.]